jgi:hypothetical protein
MKEAMLLLLASLSIAQAVEPTGTLTLACEGTANDKTDLTEATTPKPVSMGLIIDFKGKTIAGFERAFPTFSLPVEIINVDTTNIGFSSNDGSGGAVFGTVDRITGDVEAAMEHWNRETNKLQWATVYLLKCKSTQRIFSDEMKEGLSQLAANWGQLADRRSRPSAGKSKEWSERVSGNWR